MRITYNLVDPKGQLLASADTIGYLDGLVADLPPGRYTVDQIRDEPGPKELPRQQEMGAVRSAERARRAQRHHRS